jgi:hypothetical protein
VRVTDADPRRTMARGGLAGAVRAAAALFLLNAAVGGAIGIGSVPPRGVHRNLRLRGGAADAAGLAAPVAGASKAAGNWSPVPARARARRRSDTGLAGARECAPRASTISRAQDSRTAAGARAQAHAFDTRAGRCAIRFLPPHPRPMNVLGLGKLVGSKSQRARILSPRPLLLLRRRSRVRNLPPRPLLRS